MINRRHLLLAGAAGLLASPKGAFAAKQPAVSITIDDFQLDDTPLMTAAERNDAILATLDRFTVRAAGFPAAKYVDNPMGEATLRSWADRGHTLGNHTYSHNYYGGKDPAAEIDDILRAEAVLKTQKTYAKWFRFPYLAEGKTAEGRDAMRALLKQHGYRNGHVTIDTSDWYVNQRLLARLKSDPNADVAPYRKYYVEHLLARAAYYDGLAVRALGRSVPHTILLHHNLACGLFLGDALAAFLHRGWRVIDAMTAFADPIFTRAPNIAPAGQSLIWAIAKESGEFENELRYPGENDEYEKPTMDARGL